MAKGPQSPSDDRADDPLAAALQPPPDESPEQRARREQQQREATRVSLEIDQGIQEAKKAYDRRKKAVKILLLGQAESGKSTTLKNFQLAFSPSHFRNERLAWRTIVQLNLVRSVKTLLDVIQDEWTHPTETSPAPLPSPPVPQLSEKARGKLPAGTRSIRFSAQPHASASLTDVHARARTRLMPLLAVEAELTRRLFPELALPEVCVRAGNGWKDVLVQLHQASATSKGKSSRGGGGNGGGNGEKGDGAGTEELAALLEACREDVVGLWEDAAVRAVLRRRAVRVEDMPGFFLNDAARVASRAYEPTDDDIVRARLRTLGVEEHRFTMESGASGSEWYIYDVGGSRSMRPHWIPYFDDVQAIIFLAPLAFNLMLEEDSKVNRLEDSITLWREICGNQLLGGATLILFFNKMDILQATLASGIRVQKYVPSYGDQPNDVPHVVKYFRDKFRGYHKRLSPKPRPFYCHETSVIDTRATAVILVGVREGILRAHLQSVNVI
ncbi:G-alpha-domain-containing protein [Trametopsis cervina]|nr:G-alpha-domain-containing protein [Trametopsis cervina]